jgi:hypothetical protein
MKPYNPLDKRNLGEDVTRKLLERPLAPLPPPRFEGAGVYVIYFTGLNLPFAPYAPIAAGERTDPEIIPIYVGKAIPEGSRVGGMGFDASAGTALFKRLSEHAKSIKAAHNLDSRDFVCRYLTVDDIWIPLAENMLIERFSPLWNNIVTGFGIHTPGGGRSNQKRSLWDVLHPGRALANKLGANLMTKEAIESNIAEKLQELNLTGNQIS